MILEVTNAPGCPDPKGQHVSSQLIISLSFTLIVFIIALFVSFQSFKGLILLSNQKVYNFFNRMFYINILLFWLLFICYSIRIGICSLNYFVDNISVDEIWITICGVLGTIIWIFQLFTVEMNSIARLYYTFDNTIYQIQICYIVWACFWFIIALVCAIGGVLFYFLSHITGYEQYREYVTYAIGFGGIIIIATHCVTISTFTRKLLSLLRSSNSTKIKAATNGMPSESSKDKRVILLQDQQQNSITKNKSSLSINGSVYMAKPNLKNESINESSNDKEKELIQMASKLLTLSLVGYTFLLIPIGLGIILGLSLSNNIDLLLSWIASMVFILYGVFIKVFMYMHFPFGNNLYYHYCRCFKCCDLCIRICMQKWVYDGRIGNQLDLSYTSTLSRVIDNVNKYDESNSKPINSNDTNATNQQNLSRTHSSVQGHTLTNQTSKSDLEITKDPL